jgi:predicted cation transporter
MQEKDQAKTSVDKVLRQIEKVFRNFLVRATLSTSVGLASSVSTVAVSATLTARLTALLPGKKKQEATISLKTSRCEEESV